MDGSVMMADVMADLQQQRDGELADGSGAVGGDVHHGDPLLTGIVVVHHVVAGSQNGDQLDVGTFVNGFSGDGSLIHNDNLRIADALGNDGSVHIRSTVIDGQLAQLFQFGPAEIAGIFRVSVQNYKFHMHSPCL